MRINRIPTKLNKFFSASSNFFTKPQWAHFRGTILAIAITWQARNFKGLSKILTRRHRTRLGTFFWESSWDSAGVLAAHAYEELERLGLKAGETIYFVFDDSHTEKTGKKMEGCSTYWDHCLGAYLWGHNFVASGIWARGRFIPFALQMYLKKEFCEATKRDFKKLTEIAAGLIASFEPPPGVKVVALFDSFYLCPKVVEAIKAKRWNFISVAKSNRNIMAQGHRTKTGRYTNNILARGGQKIKVHAWNKIKIYKVAARRVDLSKIGEVLLVASRRKQGDKPISLVTDLLDWNPKRVVEAYEGRWSIELYFKAVKQHLGLEDYQTTKIAGAVKHLHLVSIAFALLTHLGSNLQGRAKQRKIRASAFNVRTLQDHARKLLLEDTVNFIYKNCKDKKVARRLSKLLIT